MIFIVGLIIIIIGLLVQLIMNLVKKNKEISGAFLLIYAIGTLILAIGNFLKRDMTTGALNSICTILALVIAIIIGTSKKLGAEFGSAPCLVKILWNLVVKFHPIIYNLTCTQTSTLTSPLTSSLV